MPKKEKKILGITREELGECLHTALRKCCDSSATSIAYNLIHMDEDNKIWGPFLEDVWTRTGTLKGKKASVTNAIPLIKEAGKAIPSGTPLGNALRCTFDLFDDNDWEGFTAFLGMENQP